MESTMEAIMVPFRNSAVMYEALCSADAPSELRLYKAVDVEKCTFMNRDSNDMKGPETCP